MPIRIFFSGLTGRIWATTARPRVLKDHGDGTATFVLPPSNRKQDVTKEAIAAVAEHMTACADESCPCTDLFGRQRLCGVVYSDAETWTGRCALRLGHTGPHAFEPVAETQSDP